MRINSKLGIIGGRVSYREGKLYAHFSFGKIVEAFAERFSHICLSSPLAPEASSQEDYKLPDNLTLYPQPNWLTTMGSVKHIRGIKTSYKNVVQESDFVFVRGNPVAETSTLYKLCTQYQKPVCHWLVGNSMELLKSHKRSNFLMDNLGRLYIWGWERQLIRGRKRAAGSFICNGQELANRYSSPKTITTVSTTLSAEDLYERDDTCQDETIRILTLCFVRPEKGIEYLIDAVSRVSKKKKRVKLIVAGSRDRYAAYQQKLDSLTEKLEVEDKVAWLGHVRYQDTPDLMRNADIFVLPTLSEGTPRVLVEARANSLPLVSTNVGGIPSSVTNYYDGLLVPAKDPEAMSEAILKLIDDSELRKNIIKNGFQRAKGLTTDLFVDLVIKSY